MINIESKITNESVGGISLGMDIKNLSGIKLDLIRKEGIFKSVYFYQIRDYPLRVWVKNNRVISIDVLSGYKGFLNDKYQVGDSLKNLLEDKGWRYINMLEGFISQDFDNVLIYTSLEDPDFSELNEKVFIDYIFITEKPSWDSCILLSKVS